MRAAKLGQVRLGRRPVVGAAATAAFAAASAGGLMASGLALDSLTPPSSDCGAWRADFTVDVDPSSVDSSSVKVLDDSLQTIPVHLYVDKDVILISPQTYWPVGDLELHLTSDIESMSAEAYGGSTHFNVGPDLPCCW